MLIRNYSDFQVALARPDKDKVKTNCVNCSMPFNNNIVHTAEGWLRTQHTGWCEDCHEDMVSWIAGDSDD